MWFFELEQNWYGPWQTLQVYSWQRRLLSYTNRISLLCREVGPVPPCGCHGRTVVLVLSEISQAKLASRSFRAANMQGQSAGRSTKKHINILFFQAPDMLQQAGGAAHNFANQRRWLFALDKGEHVQAAFLPSVKHYDQVQSLCPGLIGKLSKSALSPWPKKTSWKTVCSVFVSYWL